MSYVYQWFGVVTGWAFLTGCMFGTASLATRQMRNARIAPTKAAQPREHSGQSG